MFRDHILFNPDAPTKQDRFRGEDKLPEDESERFLRWRIPLSGSVHTVCLDFASRAADNEEQRITVGRKKVVMYFREAFACISLIVWPLAAYAAPLNPEDAASHVGENTTVCGLVASATYAAQAMAAPTFLDLGSPYPNQVFSAVILGRDRTKFGVPDV